MAPRPGGPSVTVVPPTAVASRVDRGVAAEDERNLTRIRSSVAGLATAVALTGGVALAAPAQAQYPVMPDDVRGPVAVTKVVDGDTIRVDDNGQRQTIRLVGLDTPESVDPRKPVQCFAHEASAQAETVLNGQSVYLETDPSQDSVDRYGRTLAYVWTESGRLFNLDMIAEGYAHEYTYYLPYRYQQIFRTAEDDARTNERGLWSPNNCAA